MISKKPKFIVLEHSLSSKGNVLTERREAHVIRVSSDHVKILAKITRTINDKSVTSTLIRSGNFEEQEESTQLSDDDHKQFDKDWKTMWMPTLPHDNNMTPSMMLVASLKPFDDSAGQEDKRDNDDKSKSSSSSSASASASDPKHLTEHANISTKSVKGTPGHAAHHPKDEPRLSEPRPSHPKPSQPVKSQAVNSQPVKSQPVKSQSVPIHERPSQQKPASLHSHPSAGSSVSSESPVSPYSVTGQSQSGTRSSYTENSRSLGQSSRGESQGGEEVEQNAGSKLIPVAASPVTVSLANIRPSSRHATSNEKKPSKDSDRNRSNEVSDELSNQTKSNSQQNSHTKAANSGSNSQSQSISISRDDQHGSKPHPEEAHENKQLDVDKKERPTQHYTVMEHNTDNKEVLDGELTRFWKVLANDIQQSEDVLCTKLTAAIRKSSVESNKKIASMEHELHHVIDSQKATPELSTPDKKFSFNYYRTTLQSPSKSNAGSFKDVCGKTAVSTTNVNQRNALGHIGQAPDNSERDAEDLDIEEDKNKESSGHTALDWLINF